MIVLPQWARKPSHKQTVIATSKGWVVKETGEVLKLVRDLDERLKNLEESAKGISDSIVEDYVRPYTAPAETLQDPETSVEDGQSEDVVTNTEESNGTSGGSSETEKEETAEPETKARRKPGPKPKQKED
jgi:hypothetical protein